MEMVRRIDLPINANNVEAKVGGNHPGRSDAKTSVDNVQAVTQSGNRGGHVKFRLRERTDDASAQESFVERNNGDLVQRIPYHVEGAPFQEYAIAAAEGNPAQIDGRSYTGSWVDVVEYPGDGADH